MIRPGGVLFFTLLLTLGLPPVSAREIHVDPEGRDDGPGSRRVPLRTLEAAQREARKLAGSEPVTVVLHAGTYYLKDTLRFGPEDSGTPVAPVLYRAGQGEQVVLSGGERLRLNWTAATGGVWQATVPAGMVIDQLFVDGQRLPMARYPNEDPSMRHFNGFAADAFSNERAARWADPTGAFLHAMHRHEWGDFHYRVTGKNPEGALAYEGGWQNNRRMGPHERYRMVENVREELDAPGEWFHDAAAGLLLCIPRPGTDLRQALVEAVRLRHVMEVVGTVERPVRFLHFRGLTIRHAARTFMDNREPLLRSDWTVYRGGALVFRGTEGCSLQDMEIDQVGGNAVFVDGYNRRLTVRGCVISRAGANGIAFVGSASAVRSPLFEYEERQSLADLDRTPGPKNLEYPADCLVEDCLIFQSGRFEKQTAPVQIAMAQGITVRHCSLYDVPRAGINIGDGCWGGHVIEFCDIFDTVRETGDHGSFNSWGRDRFWGLKDVDLNTITSGPLKDLPRLDMVRPNILRNNRWRCDHGWDIDLDDGSSVYEIRDNLCLNGGIKLREGFFRVCENNVMVNNSFHPHVWYRGSQDVFRHNIVFTPYRPIQVPTPWGAENDRNLLHRPGATAAAAKVLQEQSGRDEQSIVADAAFVDPARGDYRVREGSPALALGFRNFPMDQFGVRLPRLKAMARTPVLPEIEGQEGAAAGAAALPTFHWRGARVRDLAGQEFSVVGVAADAGGVLVVGVGSGSEAEAEGWQRGDLIQSVDGVAVRTAEEFLARWKTASSSGWPVRMGVRRNQFTLEIPAPKAR